jgi:hypothetical protein
MNTILMIVTILSLFYGIKLLYVSELMIDELRKESNDESL